MKLLLNIFIPHGEAASKQIIEPIIQEDGNVKIVDATWWFECKEIEEQLIVDNTG